MKQISVIKWQFFYSYLYSVWSKDYYSCQLRCQCCCQLRCQCSVNRKASCQTLITSHIPSHNIWKGAGRKPHNFYFSKFVRGGKKVTVINLYVTPVLKNVVVLYICNETTLTISSLQREVWIHRLNYVWSLWVKDKKSHPEQALTVQILLTWRFCNIRTHTNSALKEIQLRMYIFSSIRTFHIS